MPRLGLDGSPWAIDDPSVGAVDPGTTAAAAPQTYTPSGQPNDIYDQIASIYKDVTGGAYTPTQADVSQWGTNIDANYMNTIRGAIQGWWASNPSNPSGGGRSGAPAAHGDPAGGATRFNWGGYTDPLQGLTAALNSGQYANPQAAIDAFNARNYTGYGYGTGPEFYSNNNTIGMGAGPSTGQYGGYLTQNSSGRWGWVPHTSAESTAPAAPTTTLGQVYAGGGSPLTTSTTTQGGSPLASYLTTSPLLAPWTQQFSYPDWTPPAAFSAPTAVTEQNDPGYQFRLAQGQLALERSAAAKGTLLTGGTLKDLTDYEQGAASAEYGNVYNRALTNYQTLYNSSLNDWTTNYNKALQNYQQSYNIYSANQANQYNRIANLAGLGQVSASQLGAQGLSTAGIVGNTSSALGSALGSLYTGAANATAAGQVGSANAWSGAFGNIANLGQLYSMQNYMNSNNPTNSSSYPQVFTQPFESGTTP